MESLKPEYKRKMVAREIIKIENDYERICEQSAQMEFAAVLKALNQLEENEK